MQIDVLIEDPRWDAADVERLATDAAKATLAHLELAPAAFELSLLACDDARIAALNAEFRGRAAPTNVLSWPETDLAADRDGAAPTRPETRPQACGETFLGDIAIGYETCAREAEEQGLAPADHVTHLIVHATLHLLGYDHLRDRDATLMEGLETEILGKLGIADPYRNG